MELLWLPTKLYLAFLNLTPLLYYSSIHPFDHCPQREENILRVTVLLFVSKECNNRILFFTISFLRTLDHHPLYWAPTE